MNGVTPDGFQALTFATVKQQIQDKFLDSFGPNINIGPEDVFGQIISIFAERESLLWEVMIDIFNSQYPLTASGVALDLVVSITSIKRKPSTKSVVLFQALIGTEGTVVPENTVFSVPGNAASRFVITQDETIGAGTDAQQTISYTPAPVNGAYRLSLDGIEVSEALNFDHDAQDLEDALNALSSTFGGVSVSGSIGADFTVDFADADGKQPISLLVLSSNNLNGGTVNVQITETQAGDYQSLVAVLGEEAGSSFTANARTLTVIENPVFGLDFTHNTVDAVPGQNVETDNELRVRREETLAANSAATLEAIKSAVLNITEVENSIVFENVENVIDAAGRPPKSFEVFAFQTGGLQTKDQEIAEAIFITKPAGIESFGTVSKIVVDSTGFPHSIKFSRPIPIAIYLDLDLTVDANYPTNGDDTVKDTIVAWGKSLGNGQDVIVNPDLIGQLASIPGIIGSVVRIGIAADPTLDDNIPIDDGTGGQVEFSDWDTGRIIIVTVGP